MFEWRFLFGCNNYDNNNINDDDDYSCSHILNSLHVRPFLTRVPLNLTFIVGALLKFLLPLTCS